MTQRFDFVVVGGELPLMLTGPSGCVIAARLAESPARPSVLLLEAGGLNDDAAHLTGTERYEVAFREGSLLNWAYMTEPQVRGQKIDYARGKGLGGSTAINFCGWVVGSSEDYDEWARLVGDDSFGWKNVRRCLQRIENFHNDVPAGFRERIAPNSEDHGTGGAVDLSYQKEWLPTTDDVFRAAEEVGLGINPDVNSGSPIGMGIGTACIHKGTRVTSASAYLSSPPSNLVVVTDALVEKIMFEQDVAVGLKIASGARFMARKEVIISGGAINSPQLLLLSGLGPEEALRKHGIPRVLDLPQVGRNLQDHCFSTAGIVIKKGHTTTPLLQQSPSPMGWFQLPAVLRSREFQALPLPMQTYLRRPLVPNWEMATHAPFFDHVEISDDEEVFSAICLVMNPQSRGTVTLKSANPRDPPAIDPRFLTHPFDRRTAIEGMREMLRFFQAPTWKQKTVRNVSWPQDNSDKAIWEAFSSNLKSSWHMAGTVKMGHSAQEACVDSSFKVIGTQNLRVADMSVCPLLPNNHTQSTAYIIGEIAAEKIVAEYGLNQVRPV
ncbi:FAD/NAD(P)-binding protein [Apiospora marii]|uniref:FAD/NAD(P)-binding protein n=1 Tax=Apiospora marii TaxID=335849 RepID=A0ABR1S5V9_9PEZI